MTTRRTSASLHSKKKNLDKIDIVKVSESMYLRLYLTTYYYFFLFY